MKIKNLKGYETYNGFTPRGVTLQANGAADSADEAEVPASIANVKEALRLVDLGYLEILDFSPPAPKTINHTVTSDDVTATEVTVSTGRDTTPKSQDYFAYRAGVKLVTDGELSFSGGDLTLGIGADGAADDPTTALQAGDVVTFKVYYG